jgi:hypothetical protein
VLESTEIITLTYPLHHHLIDWIANMNCTAAKKAILLADYRRLLIAQYGSDQPVKRVKVM